MGIALHPPTSPIGLKFEVVNNIISGDGREPLFWELDSLISNGVSDAIQEWHQLVEGGFIAFRSGHFAFL